MRHYCTVTYLARVQVCCSHTMTFCPTVIELGNKKTRLLALVSYVGKNIDLVDGIVGNLLVELLEVSLRVELLEVRPPFHLTCSVRRILAHLN